MPLLDQVSELFAPRNRRAGRRYSSQHRVQLLEGDARRVRASVKSRRAHQVDIERQDEALVVSCSCASHVRSLRRCRHIWAALLEAERARLLTGAPGTGDPTRVVPRARPAGPAAPLSAPPQSARGASPRRSNSEDWEKKLTALRESVRPLVSTGAARGGAARQLAYLFAAPPAGSRGALLLEIVAIERAADGTVRRISDPLLRAFEVATLEDPQDRALIGLLVGVQAPDEAGGFRRIRQFALGPELVPSFVPRAVASGRAFLRAGPDPLDLEPLTWDEGGAWRFALQVRGRGDQQLVLTGALWRGEERLELGEPRLIVGGGAVFTDGSVAPLEDGGASAWIAFLRGHGELRLPVRDADQLIRALVAFPELPPIDFPPGLRYEEVLGVPRPCLTVQDVDRHRWGTARLAVSLAFEYAGVMLGEEAPDRAVWDAEHRVAVRRDAAAEAAAFRRMQELGVRPAAHIPPAVPGWELGPAQLRHLVRTLVAEGWLVEADGRLWRPPGALQLEVKTGVDWFELHGTLRFGERQAALPALLAALRRGDEAVKLDDGSFGLIPEGWLGKHGPLAGAGEVKGDHLRFGRSQAFLLDALVAADPAASSDLAFARVREGLRDFAGVAPAVPGPPFVGKLRAYQRHGLGWLRFLERLGLGGCLADDMGLGKTVQVLAHLATRQGKGPSLLVVPRSLVFHWKNEAARFAPALRLLDHTGGERAGGGERLAAFDLVITTYGTLRRDVDMLREIAFDYCILDEAQAIKNAASDTARAARLLRAEHRLALSGTPIENHLGELWSLFEFLNPGMLGASSVFEAATSRGGPAEPGTLPVLRRALRPFLLRRTKEQVARDLPAKLEETLWCELDAKGRKQYDELREHYRQALLERVDREGFGRSKIAIFEALLRLRQAACHPGLLDPERRGEPSAKLDALLPRLEEVVEEGHKALVFSQFTRFLGIVRERLETQGLAHEYLDGRTRDREAKVRRFQDDPACRIFLVSLKAGGLGLNLTAADYVFLLDPWWNPAAEAQAVDRAHRIGQTRRVFAYRLIARDTIEEKVSALQRTKRGLADAILSADQSLLRRLRREDLELLLA